MVIMASGIARGRVRTTTTVESRKMAAILQIIGWQRYAALVYCVLLWYWTSMLRSIDTWQNKVSADQYHVTISRAQVPRSLVDEAEGEIWPNPICITWSPVRNVTGEASVHAQHKFGAVKAKADFDAYNKLMTGLRHDLGIFARISKFHCFCETKQTQNEVETFFLQLGRICFQILLQQ